MNHKQLIKEQCYTKIGNINGRCYEISWWEKRDLLLTYNKILEYTHFLDLESPMSLRIYHYLNDISIIPVCAKSSCSNKTKYHKNIARYVKYCSLECSSQDTIEKRKQTCLKRYGVDNPSKTAEVKQKIKENTLKKYGVTNYSLTQEFKTRAKEYHNTVSEEVKKETKEKRKQTCLNRYGVASPLESKVVQEKITNTMLEKYGVTSPLQSKVIQNKFTNTMLTRYGKKSYQQLHLSDDFLANLSSKEWVESELKKKSLKEIAFENNMSYGNICKRLNDLGFDLTNYSYFESEVYQFVISLTKLEVSRNVKILNGKEIDVYVDNLKVGFECNGLYWHTNGSGRKSDDYHLNKTLIAESKGIRLFQIFENEWVNNKEHIKRCISRMLNTSYSNSKVIKIVKENEVWNLISIDTCSNEVTMKLFREFIAYNNPKIIAGVSSRRYDAIEYKKFKHLITVTNQAYLKIALNEFSHIIKENSTKNIDSKFGFLMKLTINI